MSKDYYQILGVDKNASSEEIKRAFRKLAHQYHPDKPGGDEAKFKEVNEAYQVLGKPEKRQQYDQFGATFDQQGGFGGGMNWNDFMRQARGGGFSNANFDFGDLGLGDIFGDMFGFGGGRSAKKSRSRGQDIQIDLQIEFKDAAFGVKKIIDLYKQVKCSHCHGNGAEPGTPIETCSTCKGSGQIVHVQQTFLGAFQTASVCPDCNGAGKKAKTNCSKCKGQGVVKEKEEIEINVPAGIEDGSALRLVGKGNAGAGGNQSGDLYVNIHVKPDRRFERDGSDLYTQINIPFTKAILGDKVDVETLDGTVSLKIPGGTQPGTRFRLRGQGLTELHGSGRGDMYVEVLVEIPKSISRSQKKLLEEFGE